MNILFRVLLALFLSFTVAAGLFPASPALAVVYSGQLNVQSYGAIPDDGLDDTAAILAATNAASAAHTVLYFPGGTYICGPVHLTGNVILRGGRNTRIQAKDLGTPWVGDVGTPWVSGATSSMFYCLTTESMTNLLVEDIEFYRTGNNGTKYAFWAPAPNGTHNSDISFNRCTFNRMGVGFFPNTDGLRLNGSIIKDLWADHTYNAGAYGSPDYLNVIQALSSESSTNVTITDNRASNIWSFCILNGGSSAGYGNSVASNTIISRNIVQDTADTCFFCRATAGNFENVRYEGNVITNCGKTPIKAEINNNSGTNQFRNVIITGNEIRDWGRYAGGEAVLVTCSLSTAVTPKGLACVIANNAAYAATYGSHFVQAINWDSLDISHNKVYGAKLALINYSNNVALVGNAVTLANDTTAVATYGIRGLTATDNHIVGNYDGPVFLLLDDTQNFTLGANVLTNNKAALTSPNYVVRCNNTGGGGTPTTWTQAGMFLGNIINLPAYTFSDALSTTAKPFYLPDATQFAFSNNIINDLGGFHYQGASIGTIANLGYYYTVPGTMKTNTNYTNLLIADAVGSGSGSTGAVPFEAVPKINTAATYTLASTDFLVYSNPASGTVAYTLPVAPVVGVPYVIKDMAQIAATSTITITPSSGTIDGAANKTIVVNGGSVTLIYTGTTGKEWSIH